MLYIPVLSAVCLLRAVPVLVMAANNEMEKKTGHQKEMVPGLLIIPIKISFNNGQSFYDPLVVEAHVYKVNAIDEAFICQVEFNRLLAFF